MLRSVVHRSDRLAAGATVIGAATLSFLLAWGTPAWCALAQGAAATPLLALPSAKPPGTGAAAKTSGTLKLAAKPAWQDLTAPQQMSLQPLAPKWSTLTDTQKRKWIAIAATYPKLTATEQAKLQGHMTEWVALSPQQRFEARLNFAQSKQIPPTQKAANWEAYQALDPEEKKKLASAATPKPVGAATATKPVPAQKLAKIPLTRQTPKGAPRMAATAPMVNRNTLLPHAPLSMEPVPPAKN